MQRVGQSRRKRREGVFDSSPNALARKKYRCHCQPGRGCEGSAAVPPAEGTKELESARLIQWYVFFKPR